jgi:hypothetical protein
MAYPYSRRRQPRNQQPGQFVQPQPQVDMTDANGNGYPDVFDAEEAQLMRQIAARRKAFMNDMGKAEDMFTSYNNSEYIGDGDDQQVMENLLR